MRARAIGWSVAILMAIGGAAILWQQGAFAPSAAPIKQPAVAKNGGKGEPVADNVIAEFEGGKFEEGASSKSGVFNVKPDWEIDVKGRGEIVYWGIYREGHTHTDNAAYAYTSKSLGGHSPEKFNHRGFDAGRFYLFVRGKGTWKAKVIQHSGKP